MISNVAIKISFLTFLFRCTADGEGVPLIFCDGRDVDEDVVARAVVKMWRSLNNQMSHFGGQQQPRADVCFSSL